MYWAEADFEKEGQRAGQRKTLAVTKQNTDWWKSLYGAGGGKRTVQLVWPSLKSAPASLE